MKNEIFEFYAKNIWPLVRPFVRLSKRCQRCILNEHATQLTNGICVECQNMKEVPSIADTTDFNNNNVDQFKQRMNSLISTNAFDCIFLLSGGKDSAFTLYRLRQEFPDLKILAITVNNGFMSPYALANAEKAALKLNVNWLLVNSEVHTFYSTTREAFLKLDGKGCSGVVDYADGSLIFEQAKKLAQKLNIPAVVSGMSWVQVQRIVGVDQFEIMSENGVAEIFPLSVWREDEQQIRQNVIAWDLMIKGSDSPLVSNSQLITAMGIVDIKNLGYSSFEPEFAQLVREGKTDRKQWLSIFQLLEFAVHRKLLDKDLRTTLKTLDLTVEQVIKKRSVS